MRTTVVPFNRDLRVHDHPALAAACRDSQAILPLFVVDDRIASGVPASPNRAPLLKNPLQDLRTSLRARSGDLIVRRGDPVSEAVELARSAGADAIYASADVSPYARHRETALETAARDAGVELRLFPGPTVVPPDEVKTKAETPYRVFTPYWRAWSAAPRREVEPATEQLRLPSDVDPGDIPPAEKITPGPRSPRLPRGGEFEARAQLDALVANAGPPSDGDEDLANDEGSRLGAAIHLGCLSPLEVEQRVEAEPNLAPLVRSLAWRDYFHQLLHFEPSLVTDDFRPRGVAWRDDPEAIEAWREGRTGFPIVDAAMRQLLEEGWMHNRLRMVVASFLTKHLGIDWRIGAAHFMRWLIDGDVANNFGNWQWVAGTGTDTRPNRILNPVRQAHRFDPSGDFVRRYVPEVAPLEAREVHEPWRLAPARLEAIGYPDRIIDHEAAADAFRERIAAG